MEKRYTRDAKLSTKNTFYQFDQNEIVHSPPSAPRYLFDFSGKAQSNGYYNFAKSDVNVVGDAGPPSFISAFTNATNQFIRDKEIIDNNIFDTPVLAKNGEDYVGTITQNAMCQFDAGFDAVFSPDAPDYEATFRAGYIEFTFKSDKENMAIMSGSSEISALDYIGIFTLAPVDANLSIKNSNLINKDTSSNYEKQIFSALDQDQYYTEQADKGYVNLSIDLKDGFLFLKYEDLLNQKDIYFELLGNTYLADNEWHHVVINFGRPGQIKYPGSKHNKKFIEFWVNGQLDKRFNNQIIENEHLEYPLVENIFVNIKDAWVDFYNKYNPEDFINFDSLTGLRTAFSIRSALEDRVTQAIADYKRGFRGAFHTFVHGTKVSLDPNEINKRYSLWSNTRIIYTDLLQASSEILQPSVSTNKKKALKLFWNNLLDTSKNGVALDDNYQVETYSVTNKTMNSPTELFNENLAKNTKLNILQNVKVALTSNVLHYAPASVKINNDPFHLYVQFTPPFGTAQVSTKDFESNYSSTVNPSQPGRALNRRAMAVGPIMDASFSGVDLFAGDRILLTNQTIESQNGIWIYNGKTSPLTRDPLDTIEKINNGIVYVEEGIHKNTYWVQSNSISSVNDWQKWNIYEQNPTDYISSKPIYLERYTDNQGIDQFINLQNDLDITRYDLIVFMNYPTSKSEVYDAFPNETDLIIQKKYDSFIESIKNAVVDGANIFVSSPVLAQDLGIVGRITELDQELESGDPHSSEINPFEINEPGERYFDTHRQNLYHLNAEISGLTNKSTYVMTDFINYLPQDQYDSEEYHAKYSNRPLGLQEGDEFIIPSLALRQVQQNSSLPGNRNNAKFNSINLVKPSEVLSGTILTSTANNHYHGADLVVNEYDDYASTIVVQPGDSLDGQIISGKVFVNFVEDTYAMSIEEYNKGIIQNVPIDAIEENASTRLWQYSTSRLDKKPKTSNLQVITLDGQTVPTNSGGGGIIQAPTHSSIGEIRNTSELNDKNYSSDLYFRLEDEKYDLTEIPVLSMTWLGLKWLES